MKIRNVLPTGFALALAVGCILMIEGKANGQPPADPVAAAGDHSAGGPSPTPLPPVPSDGDSNPARRQSYSLSAQERDLVMDPIKKMDALHLFQAWIDAGRVDFDPTKQYAISNYLSAALQFHSPGPVVYEEIRSYVGDAGNSFTERGQLLNVLGEAKTKEALDILIQTATTSPDAGLRVTASKDIKTAGSLWGDGKFHEELAPALERVWSTSQDHLLLMSTAEAMGRVGAPSSIKLLVSSALAGVSEGLFRERAAEEGLHEVLNPRAVPVLADLLVNQPPASATARLASSTLAGMGGRSAAKSLLEWLEGADATAAPLAKAYVIQARSPALLKAFRAAVDLSVPFHSEENREAIRSGLEQYNANRKFGP
jgi:HEAT repeat protein